jgi:hypothetical protein
MKKDPILKNPFEHLAFLYIALNTKEGKVYAFFAVDAFDGYAINLDVERDLSPESILKNVYFLCEHPEFSKRKKKDFTLIMEEHEELSDQIFAILEPECGKVIFNKKLNNVISNPFLEGMKKFMAGRK